MESQDNKVIFRYNNRIKERQLIPENPHIEDIINLKRYGYNNNFSNMSHNQELYKSRINLIKEKCNTSRKNISDIVNEIELNNFNSKYINNKNLENENKLYDFLLNKNKISLGHLLIYNHKKIIHKDAKLLDYIVNELKIKTPTELRKLMHVIDLILNDYIKTNNKILLKKRCNAILNLIKNISKNLKDEIINMSYHPTRVLTYHRNEIGANKKNFFNLTPK